MRDSPRLLAGFEISNQSNSFPSTKCSVPKVNTSRSVSQGLSRATNMSSDNEATVPQEVPATSRGSVYCLNPSSGPKIFGGTRPINVSSTVLMSVEGPKFVFTVSIAAPRLDFAAFMVQDLAQLLASSKKDCLSRN